MSPRHFSCICALSLSLFGTSQAAITMGGGVSASTQNEVNSTDSLAYSADVSTTDLLNGLTPTFDANWFTSSGRTPANMADGVHGGTNDVNTLAQTSTPTALAVFDLGTGANGLGYDLSSIVSIASWRDSGFQNQNWILEVAGVGADGSLSSTDFSTLVSVDYQSFSGGGATKVTIGGLSGALTSGVRYIRLTALASDGNSGRTAWRELDITGTATAAPEPSAMLLGALGSLLLLPRRR